MKIKNLILGLAVTLTILSCNKDDESTSTELNEARVSAKIDLVTEDVAKIVEDEYSQQANPGAGKNAGDTTQNLPPCATVEIQLTENNWTRTVTFNNCTLPNGNVLDGTIVVSGSTNFDTPSYTINYSFIDFYHNDVQIEGNRTVIRSLQSTTTLAAVHPVANMEFNMIVTFPNGNVYNRTGNRIREMIEGYQTPYIWIDNTFSITGSWTTTFPAGTQTSTITTALIAKVTCPHIVSGGIEITRNGNLAVLDYGDGNCDNQADLTFNGNTTTIILGN